MKLRLARAEGQASYSDVKRVQGLGKLPEPSPVKGRHAPQRN